MSWCSFGWPPRETLILQLCATAYEGVTSLMISATAARRVRDNRWRAVLGQWFCQRTTVNENVRDASWLPLADTLIVAVAEPSLSVCPLHVTDLELPAARDASVVLPGVRFFTRSLGLIVSDATALVSAAAPVLVIVAVN